MSDKFSTKSVKGMRDLFNSDYIKKFELVFNISRLISKIYGYSFVETPILERTELFVRSAGEFSDVTKELYSFVDKDGSHLSLRPEFTASITRMVLENSLQLDLPLKVFSYGQVFRRDRPQKDRYRQFYQANFENIGIADYKADAEMIIMLSDLLKRVKISRKKFFIRINSLGSTDAMVKYERLLKEYFINKKSQLSEISLSRLEFNPMRILDSKEQEDVNLIKNAPLISDCYLKEDKDFFENFKSVLDHAGIDYFVNPLLVRGLDYYSSVVFEFIMNDSQSKSQNSFIGGGRYNGLFSKLTNEKVNLDAFGCAIGVDRMMSLIDFEKEQKEKLKVAALQADDSCSNYFFSVLSIFRNSDIEVCSFFEGSLSKRLSKSVKRNFTHAIIVGKSEAENLTVILKDLSSSEQREISFHKLKFVLSEL